MGPVTKVLLLLALVVPTTAYVAGSLAASDGREPADRTPVILRDATPSPSPTIPPATRSPSAKPDRDDDPPDGGNSSVDQQGEARVVTPLPTPVGEDDDDEWDDDGPDDDDDTDDDSERGDD